MKLNDEQKQIVLRALRAMAGYSPQALAEKADRLIDEFEQGEVHVMTEGKMDRITNLVRQLNEQVQEHGRTTRKYIEHVQKHCVHRFWKIDPAPPRMRRIKTTACEICGKPIEMPADTLRLMED